MKRAPPNPIPSHEEYMAASEQGRGRQDMLERATHHGNLVLLQQVRPEEVVGLVEVALQSPFVASVDSLTFLLGNYKRHLWGRVFDVARINLRDNETRTLPADKARVLISHKLFEERSFTYEEFKELDDRARAEAYASYPEIFREYAQEHPYEARRMIVSSLYRNPDDTDERSYLIHLTSTTTNLEYDPRDDDIAGSGLENLKPAAQEMWRDFLAERSARQPGRRTKSAVKRS